VLDQCPYGTPGAVMALHTAGDLLGFHCHLPVLFLAGAMLPDGSFQPLSINAEALQARFTENVFEALLDEGLITPETVAAMQAWPHSGFHCFVGDVIPASDKARRLFVARYLKKCPVSNERLHVGVIDGQPIVTYTAYRNGTTETRTFTPLEFLAELSMHIPDTFEQTGRSFGIYSSRTVRLSSRPKPAAPSKNTHQRPPSPNPAYSPLPRGQR
jgi:hypothetical protein